jgi:malonate transporter
MRLEIQRHGLERLTYYVLFPALLIQTLVKADLSGVAGVGGALIITVQTILAALTTPIAIAWAT